MKGIPLIEYVGYLASILIAVSMFMKDIVKLRLVNLFGCIIFVIYAIIIKAYPVAVTNIIITFTNIYYLYKIFSDK